MMGIKEMADAFKPRNLMSNEHYLRRERVIVFQLTTILTTASGAVSSYALNKFVTAGDRIKDVNSAAILHNTDIKAAGALTISAGAVTGTICGILFLVLVFKPVLQESRRTILVKEVLFGLCTLLLLVSVLFSTIVAATGHASISGVDVETARSIAEQADVHLAYKNSAAVIAFVVLGWAAFVSTASSLTLVSLAARHDHKHGQKSASNAALEEKL